MVKRTQTVRQQIADEYFECVWPFYGIGAETVKILLACLRVVKTIPRKMICTYF